MMGRAVAVAAAAGPALWAMTLVTGYSVAERSCEEAGTAPAIVWLLPWIALAGTCLSALLAVRAVVQRRADGSSTSERTGFIAAIALGSSLLFAVAIAAQGVVPAVLRGCG